MPNPTFTHADYEWLRRQIDGDDPRICEQDIAVAIQAAAMRQICEQYDAAVQPERKIDYTVVLAWVVAIGGGIFCLLMTAHALAWLWRGM